MSYALRINSTHIGRKVWTLALTAVLSIHFIAASLAYFLITGEAEDDLSGAPSIEISMEPVSAREIEHENLPPGPHTNESTAATSSVASSETKELNEEKITRTDSEEADLARSQNPEKPIETKNTREAQEVLSSDSAASEATAPPKSDAEKKGDKPAAPVHGMDNSKNMVILTWQKQLSAHLHRSKKYPSGANNASGEVHVTFVLDRGGHVISYGIKKSSGQQIFDDAVIEMMKRADPVPAPPPEIADETLTFDVPVLFRARKKI